MSSPTASTLNAVAASVLLPQITELPQITLLPVRVVLPHTTELPQITELPFSRAWPQITELPQISEMPKTEARSVTSPIEPSACCTATGESALPLATSLLASNA